MNIINYVNSNKNTVLILLILLLLWNVVKNNLILIAGIVYLFYLQYVKKEPFDHDGNEFVRYGDDRYDLRGVKLTTYPVEYWISEKRYGCCKY